MKPITPAEAEGKKINVIEPQIIQAVNELIIENLNNGYASFKQEEVIKRYFKIKKIKNTNPARAKLYNTNQFDFEYVFKEVGWIVDYDKPGFNETYDAFFIFKKK